jgi:hypothetical protein
MPRLGSLSAKAPGAPLILSGFLIAERRLRFTRDGSFEGLLPAQTPARRGLGLESWPLIACSGELRDAGHRRRDGAVRLSVGASAKRGVSRH